MSPFGTFEAPEMSAPLSLLKAKQTLPGVVCDPLQQGPAGRCVGVRR